MGSLVRFHDTFDRNDLSSQTRHHRGPTRGAYSVVLVEFLKINNPAPAAAAFPPEEPVAG